MLCVAFVGNAQSLIDSLKIEGYKSKPEGKSKYYNEIGIRYYNQQQFDSAIKYLELAADFASQNDQYELSGQAFNNAGAISDRLGDYKKAIHNYQLALLAFKRTQNDTLIAQSQTNLGIAYKRINIYEKALDELYESAKTLQKLGMNQALSSCYNTIGNIHREIGTMEISLDYLMRSLSLCEELGYQRGIGQAYQNLGIWHLEQRRFDEANDFFSKSLKIKNNLKDERSAASTLAKIGESYIQLDSLDKAVYYFEESLAIREKYKDLEGIATSSNHLARAHLILGNPKLALQNLTKAKYNAEKGSFLQEQATSLNLFREYYTQIGDFRKALDASNELIKVNEEILNNEKAKSLIESEIKFEVSLKDQEISLKQSELDSLNRTKKLLVIIITVLVVLGILIIALFRESKKLSRERKIGKERVERLLKELNHRTKNHLQTQSGLIKQQMLKLRDQATKDVIKDIDNQIKSINLIHQSLYSSTESSPECINLTTYVENIVENLMISFGMTRNQVNLKLELDKVDIDIHKAMPVGLILNESVTNVFKHAFESKQDKSLMVTLKKEDHNMIVLTVSDNGQGFLNKSDDRRGGVQIMRDLADELDGSLKFDQNLGTMVQLKFPFKK